MAATLRVGRALTCVDQLLFAFAGHSRPCDFVGNRAILPPMASRSPNSPANCRFGLLLPGRPKVEPPPAEALDRLWATIRTMEGMNHWLAPSKQIARPAGGRRALGDAGLRSK